MIQKQIRFTRDYQDIGVNEPRWHNITAAINDAVPGHRLKDVVIELHVEDLEIFAEASFFRKYLPT